MKNNGDSPQNHVIILFLEKQVMFVEIKEVLDLILLKIIMVMETNRGNIILNLHQIHLPTFLHPILHQFLRCQWQRFISPFPDPALDAHQLVAFEA